MITHKSKFGGVLLFFVGLFAGFGIISFIIFIAGFAFYLFQNNNSALDNDPGSVGIARIGSQAPDFELSELNGNRITLSSLNDRFVIINFWATWCEPCKIEMPYFQEIYDTQSQNLEVLAINNQETDAIVRPYIEDQGFSYPILLDPNEDTVALYNVVGFPTTFFIDKSGVIRYKHVGALGKEQLNSYLRLLGVDE